ncbi:PhaM family polyhydroxyalkanoate granule multifunctional regulatory protein [Acidovorax sp.]|uniref:PhaM family polyhydroxyalkanoate granule multifunctional regulatory protein n=1 Tax=Acidovorax sp. TaxID=1872122 RepID=UPI003D003981
MSDTSNFGFGKFVPGFDFLQSLAKGASTSIPQLPNLSNWVAPTISVEELDKRIDELKAVQFWLEQNSRALAATIQALEVQKMTLATLKGMNFSMGDVANAFKLKTADTAMSGVQKAADTVSGAAGAVAGAAARVTGRAKEEEPEQAEADAEPEVQAPGKAKKGKSAASAPDASVVDPLQWWGALTGQFQQIAANAMKDAAKQTALDTTKNMATGLAKEAIKTATGMASQFAAKGMKSMSGERKPAAKKPAAKPAAKARPAAKKATAAARRAPRKSAG